MPDLTTITKLNEVIRLLGNPFWESTVVKGENQQAKIVFTREKGEETETRETIYFRRKIINKCKNKAPIVAQKNREITEDLQLEIMDELGQCRMYLNLNHKDGTPITGRTKHVEVLYANIEGPIVLGFKRHKKDSSFNDGIYTVVLCPYNWTGRAEVYNRGINFTIEKR